MRSCSERLADYLFGYTSNTTKRYEHVAKCLRKLLGHHGVSNHQPFDFLQQLVQANVQEDIIIQYYGPFVDKSTMLGGFPWQGNNNAENVSMPSRHHGVAWNVSNSMATLAGRNQAPVWGGEGPQITKFMGPTWGPPGSCRPQMGPMLAPWTMLSKALCMQDMWLDSSWYCTVPYPSFPRALPKPPRNMSKTAKPIIVVVWHTTHLGCN